MDIPVQQGKRKAGDFSQAFSMPAAASTVTGCTTEDHPREGNMMSSCSSAFDNNNRSRQGVISMDVLATLDTHIAEYNEASFARSSLAELPPSTMTLTESLRTAAYPARNRAGGEEMGPRPRTIATTKARSAIAGVKQPYSTTIAVKSHSASLEAGNSGRWTSDNWRQIFTRDIESETGHENPRTRASEGNQRQHERVCAEVNNSSVRTEEKTRQENSAEEEARLVADSAIENAQMAAATAGAASDEVTLSLVQMRHWKEVAKTEGGEAAQARETTSDVHEAQLKHQQVANAAVKEMREARPDEREGTLRQRSFILGSCAYKPRNAGHVGEEFAHQARTAKARLTATATAAAGAKDAAGNFGTGAATAAADPASDPASSTASTASTALAASTATTFYTNDTNTMSGMFSEDFMDRPLEREAASTATPVKNATDVEEKDGAKSLRDVNYDQLSNGDQHEPAMKDAKPNRKRSRPTTTTNLAGTPSEEGSTTRHTFARDSCAALEEAKSRASKRAKKAESAALADELDNRRLRSIVRQERLRGFAATTIAAHAQHEATQAAGDAGMLKYMEEDAAVVTETDETVTRTAERVWRAAMSAADFAWTTFSGRFR